jgi:hypothetical protein
VSKKRKKIGRPKGRLCTEPMNPNRVRKAKSVYAATKSYAAVARALGGTTRSGARLLLKRWENWN